MPLVPFYGSRNPDMFAIERCSMDPRGLVGSALERRLPAGGPLLDIGAGDGFLASRLCHSRRVVVAMEPDLAMIDRSLSAAWVAGEAEGLPFRSRSFAGAFATWAWFFPSIHSIEPAVREAERVLQPGGVLAIVNNLGGDEFCALAPRAIAEPAAPFRELGFSMEVIDTSFEFESLDQARALLAFYFGAVGRDGAKIRLSFRVGLFHKRMPQ